MVTSVLGSVALGYQFLWDQLRQPRGVQLFVGQADHAPVDAQHLLNALSDMWPDQAPTLLLSIQSPRLLRDLLENAPASSRWIEVNEAHLQDPALARCVQQAHQRGLKLIWRGEPGDRPDAALAPCFLRTILSLTPVEALASLRVSLRKHNDASARRAESPVLANQLYESVASGVLAEHCLDQQNAWGVAGWPMEDVLHGYRQQRIQPGQTTLMALLKALDADAGVDTLEPLLSEDPILAYRFLRFTQSASLGLRADIESVRQGLLVLGSSVVRGWLLEQLPHASSDLNLQPVRTAIVMRARLMAQLLEAGEGDELRRELFLCGLLSQIDLLLGEPLSEALTRLRLSKRIGAAVLSQSGPYLPYLEIATALESPRTEATRALCETHQMNAEDVNRTLLRTLASLRLQFD